MHKLLAIALLSSVGCTSSPETSSPDAAVAPTPTPAGPLGFTYGRTAGADEVLAGSNMLLAIPIDLPTDGVLVGIGLIATHTDGEQLYFGLYTDDNGQLGTLVQASPLTTLVAGTNEAPVAHTRLTAGHYWMLETSTSTTAFASDGTQIQMLLVQSTFGPLPPRLLGSTGPNITGKAPDAYVRVLHWADYGL